jgi:uncharacterized membrane protein YdjX (TVP38/TMEM64 family)
LSAKKPILATVGLIAVTLSAFTAIEPLREAALDAVSGETASLRTDLRNLEGGGVLLIAALAALHTFVWYPAEILDAAAGFVYGFWPAMAILTVCWTAQGMLAYEIGRRAARPVLERYLKAERVDRLERAVDEGGVTLLLAARLVPIVPFSLFSYVAGAAAAPRTRFAWTTAVGYLPITALSVYLGTRLDELSLTDPRIWAAVAGLLALLLLARFVKPMVDGD